MSKSLLDQYKDLLKSYKSEVEKEIREVSEEASEYTLKLVKERSPYTKAAMRDPWRKGKAHYRSGWKVTYEEVGGLVIKFIIHNEKYPTLTHLLENGHNVAPAWQYRFGTRVRPIPHIKPSEADGYDYYYKKLATRLKNIK